MTPNLFHFATSELSQDAFLCWLLSWADQKNKITNLHLHQVAKDLIRSIFHRAKVDMPEDFSSVDIRKQFGHIDILCIINSEIAILIEDKVGTKQHSDQLARYKTHVFKEFGFPGDKIIPVYLQTGDQSDFIEVEKHGYLSLLRKDLLQVFESAAGDQARVQSDIFRDFSSHIKKIEADVQSYSALPISEWSWNSWIGFYSEIQRRLQEGGWDYVANPSGGFLGFWWHFVQANDCEVYLQLEQDKFCFKISVDDVEKRWNLRQYWHEQIVSKCQNHGIKARRPSRFGSGQYMTVAILDQEYRMAGENGLLSIEETVKVLKLAQTLIDDCLSTI